MNVVVEDSKVEQNVFPSRDRERLAHPLIDPGGEKHKRGA
jgi:hypothetical protein